MPATRGVDRHALSHVFSFYPLLFLYFLHPSIAAHPISAPLIILIFVQVPRGSLSRAFKAIRKEDTHDGGDGASTRFPGRTWERYWGEFSTRTSSTFWRNGHVLTEQATPLTRPYRDDIYGREDRVPRTSHYDCRQRLTGRSIPQGCNASRTNNI